MLKTVNRSEVENAVEIALQERFDKMRNEWLRDMAAVQAQVADLIEKGEKAVHSVERREKTLEKEMEDLKKTVAEYTSRLEDVEGRVGL